MYNMAEMKWLLVRHVKAAVLTFAETNDMQLALDTNQLAEDFEPVIRLAVEQNSERAREWALSETNPAETGRT